jgi:hypothetical protein
MHIICKALLRVCCCEVVGLAWGLALLDVLHIHALRPVKGRRRRRRSRECVAGLQARGNVPKDLWGVKVADF